MVAKGEGSRCYDALKALLLDGEIAMGTRLTEADLAARLGSSRTPIREALRRLHAEGFIEFSANKGYAAASYTTDTVREIYHCRALIESEAVRLAAHAGLPSETRIALEAIVDETEDLFGKEHDPATVRERFLALNNRFHRELYEACPNRTLLALVKRTSAIPRTIRHYFHFDDSEVRRSHDQHRAILRAITLGDAERAAALMREHIWSAKDRMIASPNTAPAYGTAPNHELQWATF
ncbi:MAG: GntR family transcriptional regulator [Devosia sp.]